MTAALFSIRLRRPVPFPGIMRRPNIAEIALPATQAPAQWDQMRQVVHELRTPLGRLPVLPR
ncbi:MAG: hypothetical protein IPP23_10020 [Sphingomonadales bacterium]|nr:hypothetical protein [Sphingomonadales bacterium]